jgi:hypothetical protein
LNRTKLAEYNPTQTNALFDKYLKDDKRTVITPVEVTQSTTSASVACSTHQLRPVQQESKDAALEHAIKIINEAPALPKPQR